MKKTPHTSFRKSLLSVWMIVAIPLILMLLIFNVIFFRNYNQRYIESNQNSMSLYCYDIQKNLSSLDSLISTIALSSSFSSMASADTPLQAHNLAYDILSQYRPAIYSFGSEAGSALFLYNREQQIYRDLFPDYFEYEQQAQLRDYFKTLPQEQQAQFSLQWGSQKIGNSTYLIRMLSIQNSFAAVVVDLEKLLEVDAQYSQGIHVLCLDQEQNVVLDSTSMISDVSLLSTEDSYHYLRLNGSRYLVLNSPLKGSDLHLFFLTPPPSSAGILQWNLLLPLLAAAISLVMLLFSYRKLTKYLIAPMNRLVKELETDHPSNPQEYPIEEFNQVGDRVTQLKIQNYETEIERQKAQMQYLQLQLRPHFFLNCLKSLYGMAQRKKYEQIQEMILAISSHLRYYFQDNLQLVPLEQEVSHVVNYMNIQQMGLYTPPCCTVSIDSGLEHLKVPPLLLQTFVENSVKYAMQPQQLLQVSIKATCLTSEGNQYADITIRDNGSGFSQEMLDKLNGEPKQLFAEKHIGIYNILQRLDLLYEGKAVLAFFNDEGAVVEVILPISQPQKGSSDL